VSTTKSAIQTTIYYKLFIFNANMVRVTQTWIRGMGAHWLD